MKFVSKIREKSLLPIQDSNNLIETLANNLQTYIIETPMFPIADVKGGIFRLYFPTPYKYNTPADNLKLIQYTHKLIKKHLQPGLKKIIIDLRANLGGDFTIFYSALYTLLPDYKNKEIITGVNAQGEEVMRMKNDNDNFVMFIKRPGSSKFDLAVNKPLIKQKIIHKVPVYVEINEKSMSSSQLIAIMFLQTYGRSRVSGYAPELYTNGSLVIPGFDQNVVVIPYYFFKDLQGQVYQEGIQH